MELEHDPIDGWLVAAQAGDATARDKIVMEMAPVAEYMTKHVLNTRKWRKYWHLKDDLVQGAVVQLVQAIDLAGPFREPGKFRKYLSKAMLQRIKDDALASSLVSVPAASQRRALKRATDEAAERKRWPEEVPLDDIDEPISSATLPADDLWELLTSCCQTSDERRLLVLRREGASVQAICDELAISARSLFRSLTEIRERVMEVLL